MRKLMCFSIGFTIGTALGIWLLTGVWMLAGAAGFAVAFILLISIHPDRTKRIIAVIFIIFIIDSSLILEINKRTVGGIYHK